MDKIYLFKNKPVTIDLDLKGTLLIMDSMGDKILYQYCRCRVDEMHACGIYVSGFQKIKTKYQYVSLFFAYRDI